MENIKTVDFTANDVEKHVGIRVALHSREDEKPYQVAVELDLFDKILDFDTGEAEKDTTRLRIHFNDPDVLRQVVNQLQLALNRWDGLPEKE